MLRTKRLNMNFLKGMLLTGGCVGPRNIPPTLPKAKVKLIHLAILLGHWIRGRKRRQAEYLIVRCYSLTTWRLWPSPTLILCVTVEPCPLLQIPKIMSVCYQRREYWFQLLLNVADLACFTGVFIFDRRYCIQYDKNPISSKDLSFLGGLLFIRYL